MFLILIEATWKQDGNSHVPMSSTLLMISLLSLRVSSGLVSDNFKRLNMKHRSYRRRGGGISGSAHKRRAWKQIMKSRGEFVPQKSWNSKGRGGEGGGGKTGACFKCREEGHWAKNCRGFKKQSNKLDNWYVCCCHFSH